MSLTPCYQCPARYAGCHGECPDYQAWSKYKADERDARRMEAIHLVGTTEFKQRRTAQQAAKDDKKRRR